MALIQDVPGKTYGALFYIICIHFILFYGVEATWLCSTVGFMARTRPD